MKERRVILFSGRVQGVGFRITVLHLAQDLTLAGTVANRDERDVELDVEGDSGEIDQLVQRLREHFGAFIRNVSQRTSTLSVRSAPGIRIVL